MKPVDEIVKKILDGIDPEKGKMLDIRALVVYQDDVVKTMFQMHLHSLADLVHSITAIKSLAAALEKTF